MEGLRRATCAAAVCFNVYVAAPAPAWVLGVERALAAVGGVAHPGKCCATDVLV